jgi:hypothetical protein
VNAHRTLEDTECSPSSIPIINPHHQSLELCVEQHKRPQSKNGMTRIDKNVAGIFVYEADELFALDLS